MKKRLWLLLIPLLFLTGCEVNYQIQIDENQNVVEKFVATDEALPMYKEDGTVETLFETLLTFYLETYQIDPNEVVVEEHEDGTITATYLKRYASLAEYQKNSLFFKKNGGTIKKSKGHDVLRTKSLNVPHNDFGTPEYTGKITVISPYKVIDTSGSINREEITWDVINGVHVYVEWDNAKINLSHSVFVIAVPIICVILVVGLIGFVLYHRNRMNNRI